MTKPKTLDQLRAEKERAETQLAQEQHKLERLENRKKYLEKGERTKRTHRLCNLGGTIESLAPEVKDIVRLILCFFDFRYLPCCCGYNPYAFIAHTVQQRVKLPPPGGFLRIAVREEKLIYRNMIPGYKVIEYL